MRTPFLLQIHEALYLPNNKYTIFSAPQMSEQGVDVDDKANRHGGRQNIIVDRQKIPLQFKRGLFHAPIREPILEQLKLLPVYDITADSPWNLKDLDDEIDPSPNHFTGDSMHHNNVTKLGKVIWN